MSKAVIGLEIHIQLLTMTKMFCGCSANYGDMPNSNICPVCLGYPGTLPQLNKSAVIMGIKLGTALHGEISLRSDFSRKNYFYPDLPKGYQITQFNIPLVQNGYLVVGTKKIRINRIHLEEDTAKMFHGNGRNETLIDFNRAGMPLLEVVTEPDIENEKEAEEFLKKLHRIVKFLEISTGKMEEGALRCDVNISMTQIDGSYGTKVEIKNLNSFRSVTKAIQYEIKRQNDCNEKQVPIEPETRSYDETNDYTFPMRIKPTANDYRYFLDPDLGQLSLSKTEVEEIKKSLPELPEEALNRLTETVGLSFAEATLLVNDIELLHFFDQSYTLFPQAKILINWISSEILGYLNKNNGLLKETSLTPKNFVTMLTLLEEDKISGKMGKSILLEMMSSPKESKPVFFESNLLQESDEVVLMEQINLILSKHSKEVTEFKAGKTNILEMFMGEIMSMTNGNANPVLLKKLLTQKLSEIP
jgi:aspartyl-tRNA(Asn)/glutamyl-tRNA(Gln) amidotransferase subunit B